MPKCVACSKFMAAVGGLVCPKCNGNYHQSCVGLPASAGVPRDWNCPTCKRNVPRDNHADTPVKGLLSQPAAAPPAATPSPAIQSAATQPAVVQAAPAAPAAAGPTRLVVLGSSVSPGDGEVDGGLLAISSELRLFREELRAEFQTIRQELKDLRQEFSELRASLSHTNGRVDGLESRVDAVEQQVANSTVSAATRYLEGAVASLQMELQDRDQELLSNDVQVSGVPEEPGENAAGLATRICAKLGVELDVRDVVWVYRAGGAREAGRPRPIVLRLARRAVRDELLQAARVRRSATTVDLGLVAAPQRFYVNERLTSANRQLFQRAREAARTAGWRYVWTRDGRIFARQADGQPCNRMRRLTDLDIFKPVSAVQTAGTQRVFEGASV